MPRGLFGLALREAADRIGVTVEATERVRVLEAADVERRALEREVELLGYQSMDFGSGLPQEETAQSRRTTAQKARVTWRHDPMAGATVDMMNTFVFGRGVPRPRAKDSEVQKVLDEAWDDYDNQEALTSFDAQMALGTDLQIQSNVLLLLFKAGDGKVKLSSLNFDDVERVMPDPENRRHVLYYIARNREYEWDFSLDRPSLNLSPSTPKMLYYEHWRNVAEAKEQGRQIPSPPAEKMGKGLVYHVRINRYTESHFGFSEFIRTTRWLNAYNDMMKARVDMIKAASALIMKAKARGTAKQIQTIASKALTRSSWLGGWTDPLTGNDALMGPVRPAAAIVENESLDWQPFKLDTGAGAAQIDQQGLRAQISAGTGWPQHYLGDVGSANLATATSMELPVLKRVEARQEVFEQVFRWFCEQAIEAAVDAGVLSRERQPGEGEMATPEKLLAALQEAAKEELNAGRKIVTVADYAWQENDQLVDRPTLVTTNDAGQQFFTPIVLAEGYEDQTDDEAVTERDLSFEFKIPSPLRRAMGDVVTAATGMAQAFDPNGTNVELTRALATIVLTEAFEVTDAPSMVDAIWPKGWVDPIQAAQLAQLGGGAPQAGPAGPNPFGPDATGQAVPTLPTSTPPNAANPYGARQQGVPAERQPNAMRQAVYVGADRRGRPIFRLVEAKRFERMPETTQVDGRARKRDVEELWEETFMPVLQEELDKLLVSTGDPAAAR